LSLLSLWAGSSLSKSTFGVAIGFALLNSAGAGLTVTNLFFRYLSPGTRSNSSSKVVSAIIDIDL
jgi:hypothetical protein